MTKGLISFAASFLQEVDDLMAVFALVGSAGDVDPVGVSVGGLLDELVVVAVVHNLGEPAVEDVGVGESLALLAREVIKGGCGCRRLRQGCAGRNRRLRP